jgi:hypothetical protein
VNDFIMMGGGGEGRASQAEFGICLEHLIKFLISKMYIPMHLQYTLHFRPQLIFFCFLLLDSAVGKDPWSDVLSALANTFYHTHVLGD